MSSVISSRLTGALVVGTVAVVGTLTHAALSAGSQLFGPILIAGTNPREIALTFDDGPNPNATPQLLDLLAAHQVRATFFMIGHYVRSEPSLARRVADAGHSVGNHTMTHPWLAWQSKLRIREELAGCNNALEDALGAPVKLFRPPHGARRPAVLRIAAELDLTPVHWNIMPKDWTGASPEVLFNRTQTGIRCNHRLGRGSNILLHDGSDLHSHADRRYTLAVTERLLEHNTEAQFVTPEAWIA